MRYRIASVFVLMHRDSFTSRLQIPSLTPTELKMAGACRLLSPRLPKPPAPAPSRPLAQGLASDPTPFLWLGGCRALWRRVVGFPDDRRNSLSSLYLVLLYLSARNHLADLSASLLHPQAFAQTARDLLAKLHRAPPPDQLRQEVGDARRDQVRATNLGSLTRLPYLLCLPSKYG